MHFFKLHLKVFTRLHKVLRHILLLQVKKNWCGRNLQIITNQFLNAPNTTYFTSAVTASLGVHERTDMNIFNFSLSTKLCTLNTKIPTHTFTNIQTYIIKSNYFLITFTHYTYKLHYLICNLKLRSIHFIEIFSHLFSLVEKYGWGAKLFFLFFVFFFAYTLCLCLTDPIITITSQSS